VNATVTGSFNDEDACGAQAIPALNAACGWTLAPP
jgi:hypothetical protein